MMERRIEVRYPAWLVGVVRWDASESGEAATVTDISAGGAAIETTDDRRTHGPTLELVLGGRPMCLDFEVVDSVQSWYGTTLHVRFVGLSSEQGAMILGAIDSLDEHQRHAVEKLASRHTG